MIDQIFSGKNVKWTKVGTLTCGTNPAEINLCKLDTARAMTFGFRVAEARNVG